MAYQVDAVNALPSQVRMEARDSGTSLCAVHKYLYEFLEGRSIKDLASFTAFWSHHANELDTVALHKAIKAVGGMSWDGYSDYCDSMPAFGKEEYQRIASRPETLTEDDITLNYGEYGFTLMAYGITNNEDRLDRLVEDIQSKLAG